MKKRIKAAIVSFLLMVVLATAYAGMTITSIPGQTCWTASHTVHIHMQVLDATPVTSKQGSWGWSVDPFDSSPDFLQSYFTGVVHNPPQIKVFDTNKRKIFSTLPNGNPSALQWHSAAGQPNPTVARWYSCS